MVERGGRQLLCVGPVVVPVLRYCYDPSLLLSSSTDEFCLSSSLGVLVCGFHADGAHCYWIALGPVWSDSRPSCLR